MGSIRENLRRIPANLRAATFRVGVPQTEKMRLKAVMSSLFLHIHSAKVHRHSLVWWYTLGLGLISFFLFVLLTVSGIVLMLYYVPSVAEAYPRMQDLMESVSWGRVLRNLHRWTAHGMVVAVFLHMARVFYTASYRAPRELNWLVGLLLLVLTLTLAFTGYLLPWDQLGYWAALIGANIAGSPTEVTDALGVTAWFDVGGFQRDLLLGGRELGGDALNRFYVLHCVVLPLIAALGIGLHFFRIRKDGGLSRPGASGEED